MITSLACKEGYCFASNAYLAKLLDVKPHTITVWISDLKARGFVCLDMIKNDKGEIIQRRIYPNDTPYVINKTYPYVTNITEGMLQKRQYNNIIDNNINNKIDRLFNYILSKENEIPKEFEDVEYDEIIIALKRYDMYYSKENIEYMQEENLDKIKIITYIIALVVKNKLFYLTNKVSRDKLIQIYNECKNKQNEYKDTDSKIENFINYYYKSVENELVKDISPSFFVPNNSEIEI